MTTHFEDEICPVCNGSGEGMTERSTCYYCNGTGCVWVEVNDEQESEDEQAE
jgi:DnaJ-class molecular chaperone